MGHFCNHIGGCRGNQAEIGSLGNRNVFYLKLEVAVKGIYETFVSRQTFKGDGIDKICGILGHQNMDMASLLVKSTGQIGGFVRGNSTGDAQQYGLSSQQCYSPISRDCSTVYFVRFL